MYVYGHPVINGALMDQLPSLKVISNFGVGVDHIQLEDAKNRNILVGHTPDCLNAAVADMAWALLLSSARNVVTGDQYARHSTTVSLQPDWFGEQVSHKTLGILGMGRIGREVAERAKGFHMKLLYHNRHKSSQAEALGVEYVSLEELLAQSDFLVVLIPLNSSTRHFLSTAQFNQMKSNAIIINVSRGGVIDQEALLKALDSGKIKKAALDVTDPEPLPRDHPLLTHSNVIITPHFGSATFEIREKMTQMSVENLRRGLNGEQLLHSPAE